MRIYFSNITNLESPKIRGPGPSVATTLTKETYTAILLIYMAVVTD